MNAAFESALWPVLRYPLRQIRAFDRAHYSVYTLPYKVWAQLTAIAFIGSFLYGASLSLAIPGWNPQNGALWIAASAGLGWCILGPALIAATRRHPFTLAHACLTTMAYGEAVLVTGALLNLTASALGITAGTSVFNIVWVGFSNLIMGAALTRQLGAIGVPAIITLLCWILALNGSGAVFFAVFYRLLRGEAG